MKGLGLLCAMATAFVVNPLVTRAETSSLPEPDNNGIIKLVDDVVLTSTYVINEEKNVTIDLNGHNLRRNMSSGYLISNLKGNVTITDSGTTKGKISCEDEVKSSCIRNYKNMTIDGANLISTWLNVKNEELSDIIIKNSTVTSTSPKGSALQNYGTATIENSNMIASKENAGAAVFSLCFIDSSGEYSSTVNIKNSTLSAYYPIIVEPYDENGYNENTTITVNVDSSVFEGVSGVARVNEFLVGKPNIGNIARISVSGEVIGPQDVLNYAVKGTKLTLNEDLTGSVVVREGVTLVIPKDIEVEDNAIKVSAGSVLENNSGREFKILSETGEELVIKDAGLFDGSEVKNPTEVIPDIPSTPNGTEPGEDDAVKDDNLINTPTENPKTLDGVTTYIVIAISSIGTIGLILKKSIV